MNRWMSFFVIWSVAMLAGCLSPVQHESHTLCLLDEKPSSVIQRKTQPATLLVMPPSVSVLYDTTKMIYADYDHEIGYFGRYEWAETPANMLLPLITSTLQSTHYFSTVTTPPAMGRIDYVLMVNVQKLQQNFIQAGGVAELAASATLIDLKTDHILTSQNWHLTEPMRAANPAAGLIALNSLTSRFLSELASFVVHSV